MLTPITASIAAFSRLTDQSESSVWALIAAGQLQTISLGKRRLILVEPYLKSLGLKAPVYPMVVAPARFPSLSGLSVSSTRGLIRNGILKTAISGQRQMIVVESYQALISELKTLPRQDARRNKVVPALGSRKQDARRRKSKVTPAISAEWSGLRHLPPEDASRNKVVPALGSGKQRGRPRKSKVNPVAPSE